MARSNNGTVARDPGKGTVECGGHREGSVAANACNAVHRLQNALHAERISFDPEASNNVEYALELATAAVVKLVSAHRQGHL